MAPLTDQALLGVEGGASRSAAILADTSLELIARNEGGPLNPHAVRPQTAIANLKRLITPLLEAARGLGASIGASAFCIAGLRSDEDKAAWEKAVRPLVTGHLLVTHDAAAALAAGTRRGEGLLIISGTGSLVYGRRADGQERFALGRGPLLGDEGSGFDIGHRALRAAAASADGRGPKTLLELLVPARLGVGHLDHLIAALEPFEKRRVAAAAPAVFEAAEAGDRVAWSIIQDAAGALSAAARAVAAELWKAPEGLREVVLAGGVLEDQESFRRRVAERVREFAPRATCRLPEVEPAVGALRLARLRIEPPPRDRGPGRA